MADVLSQVGGALKPVGEGLASVFAPEVPIPKRTVPDPNNPGQTMQVSMAPEGTTSWVDRALPIFGAFGSTIQSGDPFSGYVRGRAAQQDIARPYLQLQAQQQTAAAARQQTLDHINEVINGMPPDDPRRARYERARDVYMMALPPGMSTAMMKEQAQKAATDKALRARKYLPEGVDVNTPEGQRALGIAMDRVEAEDRAAKVAGQRSLIGERVTTELSVKEAHEEEQRQRSIQNTQALLAGEPQGTPRWNSLRAQLDSLIAGGKAGTIRPPSTAGAEKTSGKVGAWRHVTGEKISPAIPPADVRKIPDAIALDAADEKAFGILDNAERELTALAGTPDMVDASGNVVTPGTPGEADTAAQVLAEHNIIGSTRLGQRELMEGPAAIADPRLSGYKAHIGGVDINNVQNQLSKTGSQRLTNLELGRLSGVVGTTTQDPLEVKQRAWDYLERIREWKKQILTPKSGDPAYGNPLMNKGY